MNNDFLSLIIAGLVSKLDGEVELTNEELLKATEFSVEISGKEGALFFKLVDMDDAEEEHEKVKDSEDEVEGE